MRFAICDDEQTAINILQDQFDQRPELASSTTPTQAAKRCSLRTKTARATMRFSSIWKWAG